MSTENYERIMLLIINIINYNNMFKFVKKIFKKERKSKNSIPESEHEINSNYEDDDNISIIKDSIIKIKLLILADFEVFISKEFSSNMVIKEDYLSVPGRLTTHYPIKKDSLINNDINLNLANRPVII